VFPTSYVLDTCIGLLHNTIQLAVERPPLHLFQRAGDGLISLEKACPFARSFNRRWILTKTVRVVAFQQRSKHTTLCHSFPLISSRLPPTSRARLQREPGCTIVLTRCYVTHGAEFRVEPVLKFCSMSEVHAGLICSTVECTTRMCRRLGDEGRWDDGKDGVR